MWSGYTPPSRPPNTSPNTGPVSPTSTYPPELYAHRAGGSMSTGAAQHRHSLSRVPEMDDSPSTGTSASGAQLVARDYALQYHSGDGMETDNEDSSSRSMTPGRRAESPVDEEGDGERFIPPESVHDKYLSKYIQPLGPINTNINSNSNSNTNDARPTPLRSTSTPASNLIPTSQAMGSKASVIPLRGLGLTANEVPGGGKEGHRPIFEIFNAELSEGSEGMVKALKGHLDSVLRVQKEIGRMHLGLEGLDGSATHKRDRASTGSARVEDHTGGEGDEDPLAKREKEVDELMTQLSILSFNLRTYHELGTPTLQFSHSNTSPLSPRTPNPPPPLQRQQSAQPDILTTSPSAISPSPPRAEVPRSLPTRHPAMAPMAIHKGIDNLKRQEGGPSRRSTTHQDNAIRQSSVNSDLSPLKLNDDYNHEDASLRKRQASPSPSPSFWDLDTLSREREREKEIDNWMEHGIAPDEPRRTTPSVIGSLRSRSPKGRKGVDSPIEMVDRTRPW